MAVQSRYSTDYVRVSKLLPREAYSRLTKTYAETVSTRFLCTSGIASSFPLWDWQTMSGTKEMPLGDDDQATTFAAKTSAWDSFVIYAVDPRKSGTLEDGYGQESPVKGLPRSPPHALPLPPSGFPVPIYYNQTIVLQCINTAVVSPVMVIRKVDDGTLAKGGESAESSSSQHIFGLSPTCAPGEKLGDAVSQ